MGVHHKPEEKLKIAELICTAYSAGDVTIKSCIEAQSITEKTWSEWQSESKEITALYSEAKRKVKDIRRKELKKISLNALALLIKGHTHDELHQEVEPIFDKDGSEIGTKTTKIKRVQKYYPPNPSAVMFALKALDPGTYRDALPPSTSEKQVYVIGGKEIEF